jgi:phospholipid-translocating ATPase
MQLEDMEAIVDENIAVDDSAILERCLQHINDFATEGLRTLLYAHRFLDESDYQSWKKLYLDATTSLVDRTRLIEEAGDLIERDLDLSAATAIEDKLQHGVPEAIDKLRRAKIKMWMLTGDKRETAINIGYSCRLIKDYSSVTVLDHEAGEVEHAIGTAILAINGGGIAHSVVVVDGQTLASITSAPALSHLFYDLAILADSVICCRASPAQKAMLVKSIRKRVKKSITLAIGDGANDIAMIQEAHVGIGITGKEGLQAARTSDYSIAQFRFLVKLLLVHGRWNYARTCKYTVGTFWKEMLFYLTQALYQRSVGYTGTSLYESWSLSMFNTLFTSLPVIFMGVFEKDLNASTLLAVPELYTKGQRNGGFNFKVYLGWMFMASAEAMVVYWVVWSLWGEVGQKADDGIFALGVAGYSACVVIIAGKMQ